MLHVGVCCKSCARQVFSRGPKRWTYDIGTAEWPTLQYRIIVTTTNKFQFHLMYCVDLNSFNENQVNEWHDDVEKVSLAVRTHSGRIELLVTRSHRPVGFRHNKSTCLCGLVVRWNNSQPPLDFYVFFPRLVQDCELTDGIDGILCSALSLTRG